MVIHCRLTKPCTRTIIYIERVWATQIKGAEDTIVSKLEAEKDWCISKWVVCFVVHFWRLGHRYQDLVSFIPKNGKYFYFGGSPAQCKEAVLLHVPGRLKMGSNHIPQIGYINYTTNKGHMGWATQLPLVNTNLPTIS